MGEPETGRLGPVTHIVDCDQHLYEPRTLWADHIDPALRRGPGSRRRRPRLHVADLAGRAARAWPTCSCPATAGGAAASTASGSAPGNAPEYRYDEALPAGTTGSRRPGSAWLDGVGLDEAVCFPNFGLLWERRLSRLAARPDRQHGGLEPLVRHGGGRRRRPAPSGRPPHPAGRRLAGGAAGRAGRGRRAAGDDRPGAGRRPAAVASRPRAACGRRSSITASRPVFHVADQPRVLRRLLVHRPDDDFVPVARVGVPVGAAGAGRDRPHPARRLRPASRAPHRRSSSSARSGCRSSCSCSTAAADFTTTLNGRPLAAARPAAERVLPAPGPGVVVLLRAAGAADGRGRRPVHVLQRLPALGGHGRPRSPTTGGPAASPERCPGCSTTTSTSSCAASDRRDHRRSLGPAADRDGSRPAGVLSAAPVAPDPILPCCSNAATCSRPATPCNSTAG